jgi:hypothetical protein
MPEFESADAEEGVNVVLLNTFLQKRERQMHSLSVHM